MLSANETLEVHGIGDAIKRRRLSHVPDPIRRYIGSATFIIWLV
jgi:hypothetical protein